MKKTVFAAALAVAGLSLGMVSQPVFAGGNSGNSTAQSVMFDTNLNGSFIISENQVFKYDRTLAANYFTNKWDGNAPTVDVQGQAHGTQVPASPSALPPIDVYLTPSISSNMCTFWNGGVLVVPGNTTYKQYAYVDVPYTITKNGKTTTGTDTYRFTFNYVIATRDDGGAVLGVKADTSGVYPWQLDGTASVGGPVTVTLDGYLAAETTVRKTTAGPDHWTFKTDFGGLGSNSIDPVTGLPMGVQNITATLTDSGNNVLDQRTLSNTIEYNKNYFYKQNAGFNGAYDGTIGQLVDGAYVGDIVTGRAFSNDSLSSDNFAGNDNYFGDRAKITPTDFTIYTPGQYNLTIAGVMQGVAGMLAKPFTVNQVVTYDTEDNVCPAIIVQ